MILKENQTVPNTSQTTTRRLQYQTLETLPVTVQRPTFHPAQLQSGILHLGCGNFHRAHQAIATQAAIQAEGDTGLQWGITAVSMRRKTIAEKLARQNGLYTVLQRGPEKTKATVSAAIKEAIYAPEDFLGLTKRIADPKIKLVTLTVTASGYLVEPSSGKLLAEHPEIVKDLNSLSKMTSRPLTTVGALAAGLSRVHQEGGAPPVILSCDNVASNGTTLRQAVIDFAALLDDRLSQWIAGNVRFPNTMVDRIVPETKPQDILDAQRLLGGVRDEAPVSAEPWFQWVIEDFEGARPKWEAAGARFVNNVEPYELAKLRMLNGTHMLLAYVGVLAGKKTISEAAKDKTIGEIALKFMLDEQSTGVPFSQEMLTEYAGELMQRFKNPGITHLLQRIGRNGSQKMAFRVLEPMRENIIAGRSYKTALLLIASWIRLLALHEENDLTIELTDPRAAMLSQLCRNTKDDYMEQARAFLDIEEIFGAPLPNHHQIAMEIGELIKRLAQEPIQHVLADFLS